MIKKLHLYIIKEFFGSFIFGLSVFSVLLLLDRVFALADLFLSKGVAFLLVLKLFVFLLPNILTRAIPMAVLFGVLISYGRLSEDNEIAAIKFSGVNYKTLSMPIIAFICIISSSLIFFNHFLSPSLNSDFRNLYERILAQRPLIKFNEKTITEIGGYRLYANKVSSGNNTLLGVGIYKFESDNTDKKSDKNDILLQNDDAAWRIAASSATVQVYQNGVQLILYNGYWQKASPSNINNIIHMTFRSYYFFIPLGNISKESFLTIREMSSPEILKTIKNYKKQNIPFIEYEKEFWFRWIFAVAPVSFVIIALPIGIMTGKSGRAIGFGVSLGIILAYYVFLMLAVTLSEREYAPVSIIWAPNVVLTITGIYLFTRMVKK
ncbi:MAG: LptF/LptG family permease [Endomicrobium sp.]|nr:LptF/LptG family permease [Endomicrobium sp.]